MNRLHAELTIPEMLNMLVVEYRGQHQIIERRYPIPGETVLAYRHGRSLVGRYDGHSVSDGFEMWTEAIVRGVVIATFSLLPKAQELLQAK